MFTREGRSRQADIIRSLSSALADGIAPEVQSEALHWLAAFQDSNTIDKLRDRLAARTSSAAKKLEALRLLAMAKAGESPAS